MLEAGEKRQKEFAKRAAITKGRRWVFPLLSRNANLLQNGNAPIFAR
jgi:hypothetical protein